LALQKEAYFRHFSAGTKNNFIISSFKPFNSGWWTMPDKSIDAMIKIKEIQRLTLTGAISDKDLKEFLRTCNPFVNVDEANIGSFTYPSFTKHEESCAPLFPELEKRGPFEFDIRKRKPYPFTKSFNSIQCLLDQLSEEGALEDMLGLYAGLSIAERGVEFFKHFFLSSSKLFCLKGAVRVTGEVLKGYRIYVPYWRIGEYSHFQLEWTCNPKILASGYRDLFTLT
jgi:hypothetical protein